MNLASLFRRGGGKQQDAQASSTCCVSIEAGQLVLTQISRVNAHPVLMHHAILPVPLGLTTATLTALFSGHDLRDSQLIHVLSMKQYHLHLTELPNVPPDEVKLALSWRLAELFADNTEQQVPDASNFSFDLLALPSTQAGSPATQGLVFGLTNHILQPLQMAYFDANLPLQTVDVPDQAQRNLSALAEPDERGLAVLSFNASGGLLTVTHGGELYLTRHLETTLDQLAQADDYTRGVILERVALEVQRSLDVFDRQYHALGLSKLLLAPMPSMPTLLQTLTQNLFLPVDWFDLTAVIDMPANLPGWLLWQSLGGALRPTTANKLA